MNQDNHRRQIEKREYREYEDDEISLIDLWLVMARRKWVIIGITFLCAVIGTAYALTRPIIYEYRTGIDLARVYDIQKKGFELIVSKTGSMALLEDVIIPVQNEILFGAEEAGPKVKVIERGDTHNLTLVSTARPDDLEKVKNFHKAIVEALSDRQLSRLNNSLAIHIKPLEAQVKMLDEQIGMLENQLERLSARSNEENGIQRLIDAQQMGDLRRELSGAMLKRSNANSAMEMIREASHETRFTFLAIESQNPAGTGKALIIALSLVLGTMLGVFGAFFTEFIHTARNSGKEPLIQTPNPAEFDHVN